MSVRKVKNFHETEASSPLFLIKTNYPFGMSADQSIRKQLIKQLQGGMAYIPVEKFLEKVPYAKTGVVVKGLPYSLWQQLYHLKFTQRDILDFSCKPEYKEPDWPDDYWPERPSPSGKEEWQRTIDEYLEDREAFIDLIRDENNDLYKPFPHGSGQNLLNEALLIIAHTAYHSGQMLVLMRLLGLHE